MPDEEHRVSVLLSVAMDAADSAACQETLRSIASQTYPATLMEVVRVQYVSSAPGGRTSALNAAREGATGAYVVQTEPGVLWDAAKVERQVERLRAGDAGVSLHATTLRSPGGKEACIGLDPLKAFGPKVGSLVRAPWAPGAMMACRRVSEKLGAYRTVDEVLWEYGVRVAFRGIEPDLLEESLSVWQPAEAQAWSTRRALFPQGPRALFLKSQMDRLEGGDLMPEAEPDAEALVLGALHLLNDDLPTCHAICQDVGRRTQSAASSYWHGIVHRREPDFDNARGWFRKAAAFEGAPAVAAGVTAVLQKALQMPDYGSARERAFLLIRRLQESGGWEPECLVGLYADARKEADPGLVRLLEEVQEAEFTAAFQWTFGQARGAS